MENEGVDETRYELIRLRINNHFPVTPNQIELTMYLGTRGFDRKITARLRVVAPCTT